MVDLFSLFWDLAFYPLYHIFDFEYLNLLFYVYLIFIVPFFAIFLLRPFYFKKGRGFKW